MSNQPSEWEEGREFHQPLSARMPAMSSAPNVFTGVVISKQEGLTRTTLRIRVSERTDLRVRWSTSTRQHADVSVGHTVRLFLPDTAVRLEAGAFRRGKQRWNRWIGRVVLVQQHLGDFVTTVKIHRDSITLRSRGPILGAHTPLTTWDTVNIVVDPEQVGLTHLRRPIAPLSSPPAHSSSAPPPGSGWLAAMFQSLRPTPEGVQGMLNLGGIALPVFIAGDGQALSIWRTGVSVEVRIDTSTAWIRRNATATAVPCRVFLPSDSGGTEPSTGRWAEH